METNRLVLSGGGAITPYHIGVWQALIDLHINFDSVSGASMGALIASFAATDKIDVIKSFMLNATNYDIYSDDTMSRGKKGKPCFKDIITKGGISMDNLEKFISKNLKRDDIIKELTIEQVKYPLKHNTYFFSKEKDTLIDKVMATMALYPVIKKRNGMVDGGWRNNVPISTAIKLGKGRIIVSNCRSIGFSKICRKKNRNIIEIKPKKCLGHLFRYKNILDFNPKKAIIYYEMGYMDAMRVLK